MGTLNVKFKDRVRKELQRQIDYNANKTAVIDEMHYHDKFDVDFFIVEDNSRHYNRYSILEPISLMQFVLSKDHVEPYVKPFNFTIKDSIFEL